MKLEEWQEEQQAQHRAATEVTEERLQPGALVVTRIGEPAITTKYGKKDLKKLIIIGQDKEQGIAYGVVVVNTKKRYSIDTNAEYTKDFKKAQLKLREKQYTDFLEYDSYINCAKIVPIPVEDLKAGEYRGNLDKNDHKRIFEKLRRATTISNTAKQRYGLIGENDETTSSRKFNKHEC